MAHLNGHYRRTLDNVFGHPTSHNVEWNDVLSSLNNVGDAQGQHNGEAEVTVGTDRIIIARAYGNDVGGDEIRQLRAFPGKAGLDPDENDLAASHEIEMKPDEQTWIVVIDHRHAKLFAIENSPGNAAAPLVLSPEDSYGLLGDLEHRCEGDHTGGRVPGDDGYHERNVVDHKLPAQIAAERWHRQEQCRGIFVNLSQGPCRNRRGGRQYCADRHFAFDGSRDRCRRLFPSPGLIMIGMGPKQDRS